MASRQVSKRLHHILFFVEPFSPFIFRDDVFTTATLRLQPVDVCIVGISRASAGLQPILRASPVRLYFTQQLNQDT